MKMSIMADSLAFSAAAVADDRLVRFDGGIGETPVSNTTTPNTVRNVPPAGQPWVISRLTADVRTDARISVDGRGLLLAGDNGIGTNGGQSVVARLSCQLTATTFSSHVCTPWRSTRLAISASTLCCRRRRPIRATARRC